MQDQHWAATAQRFNRMLTSSLFAPTSTESVGTGALQPQPFRGPSSFVSPSRPNNFGSSPDRQARQLSAISLPTVNIGPHRAVTRRGLEWGGMAVELVQSMAHHRLEFRFQSHMHLLAAYEYGVRRD